MLFMNKYTGDLDDNFGGNNGDRIAHYGKHIKLYEIT